MYRSSLIWIAGVLTCAVLGSTAASARDCGCSYVHRYQGRYVHADSNVTPIPAPVVSPYWQYTAAYYNPPRGPRYYYFSGGSTYYRTGR